MNNSRLTKGGHCGVAIMRCCLKPSKAVPLAVCSYAAAPKTPQCRRSTASLSWQHQISRYGDSLRAQPFQPAQKDTYSSDLVIGRVARRAGAQARRAEGESRHGFSTGVSC